MHSRRQPLHTQDQKAIRPCSPLQHQHLSCASTCCKQTPHVYRENWLPHASYLARSAAVSAGETADRAAAKWLAATCWAPARSSLNAASAASLHSPASSAPVKRTQLSARLSKSTSAARGMPVVCSARIARRPAASGGGTYSCTSRRPGRSRAGSRAAGRFVAARSNTPVAAESGVGQEMCVAG